MYIYIYNDIVLVAPAITFRVEDRPNCLGAGYEWQPVIHVLRFIYRQNGVSKMAMRWLLRRSKKKILQNMPIFYSQINLQSHFIQGQFWPLGIVVACICLSVCLSVCPLIKSLSVWTVITHHPFKLGSPYLNKSCKSILLVLCTTTMCSTFAFPVWIGGS